MAQDRPSRLVPLLAVLIVGAVAADVARRALVRPPPPAPAQPESTTVAAGRVPEAPGARDTVPAARRARTLDRIAAESATTYLAASLAASDSTLRRWPDPKLVRPLRLAVVRAPGVRAFRESFVSNVQWAVARWNGAMLPLHLGEATDSAAADIVVTWVERLDSNRTGRADLTWDRRGHLLHATVYLATHAPHGQPLGAREMVALALHEIGHALGLGHSPVREDALYPVTRAVELTERDRRTARLLYSLPPGPLR
jgi:hypothetical protein